MYLRSIKYNMKQNKLKPHNYLVNRRLQGSRSSDNKIFDIF